MPHDFFLTLLPLFTPLSFQRPITRLLIGGENSFSRRPYAIAFLDFLFGPFSHPTERANKLLFVFHLSS
jgi:hypothetical protein